MLDQFKKAIILAQKTGDKLIVFDSQNPAATYVVMSLSQYENLALSPKEAKNLTEEELLDRINRDIAIWKNEQIVKEDKLPKATDLDSDFGLSHDFSPIDQEKPTDFFMPNEPVEHQDKTKKQRNNWAIPNDRKEGAEEIIEEDRQYLEELTF